MDILRTKEKKHDLITPLDTYKFASGDNAGEPRRCCHICSGERGLRRLSEPRERLDHILYRCFGVVVAPSDCLICEGCACQLRTSEQFRILVEAAFPHSPSDCESQGASSTTTTTCVDRSELETLTIKSPITLTDSQETVKIMPKPKKVAKSRLPRLPKPVAKKINIACNNCKQRYPMMRPTAGPLEDFVCSRCKNRIGRKADPVAAPARVNHEKGDFWKKPKFLKDTPVAPLKPLLKKCDSVIKYHREPRKYQCSQCTQKFMFAQRLAEHVKCVHKDTLDNTCVVCGKKFKTQSNLEKHLKIHTGELSQCDVCMKIFRNNHALQTHYACHIKKNKVSG